MMTRIFLILLCYVCLAAACSSYEAPDSGIDCGRQFIDATYQGNFKRARQLLVSGENQQDLLREKIEKDFRGRNSNQKEALSRSSIVIRDIVQSGDTLVLITYQNAYNQQNQQLRVILENGEWKTDLAFSYSAAK